LNRPWNLKPNLGSEQQLDVLESGSEQFWTNWWKGIRWENCKAIEQKQGSTFQNSCFCKNRFYNLENNVYTNISILIKILEGKNNKILKKILTLSKKHNRLEINQFLFPDLFPQNLLNHFHCPVLLSAPVSRILLMQLALSVY